MSQFGRRAFALAAVLGLGMAACGEGVIKRDANPGTRSGAGGAGSTGTGSVGSGGSIGPTGTGGAPPSCTADEPPGPQLLRLMTRWEYAATVADLLGVPAPNVEPIPGSGSVNGFDNDASGGVVTDRHLDAYVTLSKDLVDQALAANHAGLVPCATAGCDRQLIVSFGRKAFRRPLADDEITRYLALFSADLTQGTFDEGVKLVLRSMLISPSFLYRSEIGEKGANGTFTLTPFELATALSYAFWGTAPDATLAQAADQGKLATAADLEAQARRLLADPRSRPQLAHFFGQWLGTSELVNTNKDKGTFPLFSTDIAKAMAAEEAAFVEHVAFDASGKFGELFTAPYVFVNQPLAQYYGLMGGTSPTDVALLAVTPDAHRGGLLTLGSVLASHAHAMDSSPIKRGVFVRRRLLCQSLPDPPPNINTTPPPLDPTKTTRDRFAAHTSNPACSQCHQYIDGIGFGFEAYDGAGAYRTTENGAAIDIGGSVLGLETGTMITTPFRGPAELAQILAKSASAEACAATQYFRYTRGFQETNACAVLHLQQAFADKGLDLKELMVSTVLESSFRVRRAGP